MLARRTQPPYHRLMVSRLRHKITLLTPAPPPFKSVYATGYVWVQAPVTDPVP